MKLFQIICAVIALSACEQKDETISGYTDPDSIWVLKVMNSRDMDERFTLQFNEPGKVRGEGPCNSFFGDQTKPLPWVGIRVRGSTRKACANAKLEAEYFETLNKATQIEAGNGVLVLSDDDGELLSFTKL